jgi:hypothetical protein
MEAIVPCRSTISDRFPLASFTIRSSEPRYFEVVCATDPRLFHTDFADRRSPGNFFSSRAAGLLVADRGDTTWIVPSHALRRFAGSQRLYYALGTYGGRAGEAARFSIAPDAIERIPSIAIAGDFTGRSLDRRRIGGVEPPAAAYGGNAGAPLRWGGDAALEAERARSRATTAIGGGYDDGYDPRLWRGPSEPELDDDDDSEVPGDDESYGRATRALADDEPTFDADECEDGATFNQRSAEQPGASPRVGGRGLRYGSDTHDEPEYEDASAYYAETQAYGARMPGRVATGRVVSGRIVPGRRGPAANGVLGPPAPAPMVQRYGRRESATRPVAAARGRHADYSDEDSEESLPIGPAARALSDATPPDAAAPSAPVPLDIPEQVRILRIVARAESGSDAYAALAADPEFQDPAHPAYQSCHHGLSFGLVLFTQRSGLLGLVLRRAKARADAAGSNLPAEQQFASLFGPQWQQLLRVTDPQLTPEAEDRVAPVEEHLLWEEPWLTRFRAAGQVPYVQAAQNEVALVELFDPILALARDLGFVTDRALALLLDRVVHMGLGGGRRFILQAIGPIKTEAERARALSALGFGGDDIASFQRARALPVDGKWGPITHAALIAALRELGPASPLPIPEPAAMLQALIAAAQGTDFEARVRALTDNGAELAERVSFALS